jgi:hypothetical protein
MFIYAGLIAQNDVDPDQNEPKYNPNAEQYSIGLTGGVSLFYGDLTSTSRASYVTGLHLNNRITRYLSNSISIIRGNFHGI